MNKKALILLALIIGAVIVAWMFFFNPQKSPLSTPLVNETEITAQTQPSETLKEYSDPSGFSFNYPDNLSLTNNEIKDDVTYADITLTAKEVEGNLALKISDTSFKTLDDWVKANSSSQTPKEVKLGELKALELNVNSKLVTAAIDKGVLFTIEIPLEDFWMKVYKNVLTSFSFAPQENVETSTNDVTFEGEEIVE